MKDLPDRSHCCGCGACLTVCPRNALSFERDDEGFDYPVADAQRCTDCGRCSDICPARQSPHPSSAAPAASLCRHRDASIRLASTSGGAFSAFAASVLERGGVVFGAAFSEDYRAVRHVGVRRPEELAVLRASKYVQSDATGAWREMMAELAAGHDVLFSGTPCQAAAARALAGADDRLVTCEVICHGVPSPAVFASHVAELCRWAGAPLTAYRFRDKACGWHCASNRQRFANGRQRRIWNWGDAFCRGFYRAAFLRPSCHVCRFARLPRTADLTMGDAWGLGRPGVEDDNRGLSLVLVNTPRGRRMMQASASHLDVSPAVLDEAVRCNAGLARPAPQPSCRQPFFAAWVRTHSLAASSRIYTCRTHLFRLRLAWLLKRLWWGLWAVRTGQKV